MVGFYKNIANINENSNKKMMRQKIDKIFIKILKILNDKIKTNTLFC